MNLLISKIHYTVSGTDSQFLIMLEHKYSHCFFAHRITHHFFTHSQTQAIDIARQVQNISRQCMSVQANSQVLYYTSVSTGYVSCILADSLAFVLSFFCFSHFLIQEIYYLVILSSNGHRKVLLIFLVAQNSSLKRQIFLFFFFSVCTALHGDSELERQQRRITSKKPKPYTFI